MPERHTGKDFFATGANRERCKNKDSDIVSTSESLLALHPNFDTRDNCSKRVQLGGANRVQQMLLLPIGFPGKNCEMHPHRVQLLHAEVSVHPVLVHFGDYDGVS